MIGDELVDMQCNNCKHEMVDDCKVMVHATCGVTVIKEKKGMLKNMMNKAFDDVKALVCPNCGSVQFYIEDYKSFAE